MEVYVGWLMLCMYVCMYVCTYMSSIHTKFVHTHAHTVCVQHHSEYLTSLLCV